jgi:hypothetical protein
LFVYSGELSYRSTFLAQEKKEEGSRSAAFILTGKKIYTISSFFTTPAPGEKNKENVVTNMGRCVAFSLLRGN